MSRTLTATDRLERMLAIVPFVASHPGGVATDELCTRFDLDRNELISCLETSFMVGVHPYTPDALIDMVIEPDWVQITMPDWFRRPLQLTSDQRLALLVARRTFRSVPGADLDGPLLRALDKVAGAVESSDSVVSMEFDSTDDSTMSRLRVAVSESRVVGFRYFSFGRNSHDHREVEPWRVQLDGGHWYLEGLSRDVGERRLFRVDRIDDVVVGDETFVPPADLGPLEVFPSDSIDRRITLDLTPAARWAVSQYPVEAVTESTDGTVRATFAVASTSWLERLLLRLGADATVVEVDPELETIASSAARRLLDRYRG